MTIVPTHSRHSSFAEKSGRWALNAVIGAVVLALVGFVLPPFGLLMLASIVCTAGAGLFIWVPVALALGAAIRSFVSRVSQKPRPPEVTESSGVEKAKTADEIALQTYFDRARAAGMNDEQIFSTLTDAGWSADILAQFHPSIPRP